MPIAAVRIRDPLPPFSPGILRAVAYIAAQVMSRAESTARVWFPMSLGGERYQSANPAATASSPSALRTSRPGWR